MISYIVLAPRTVYKSVGDVESSVERQREQLGSQRTPLNKRFTFVGSLFLTALHINIS